MDTDAWRMSVHQLDLIGQVRDYAIITLDPEGVVRSWNAGAELVKGYAADDIIGSSFRVFYPKDDRDDGLPDRLLAEAAAEGRVEHVGWRVRKDGTRFWGDVVITALRSDDGTLLGFIKVTRDLSEQHELEQARATFLAGVGHDFRSPLTSIEGYASLISSELEDPMLRDFSERIRSNAVRLMRLVDLMLDYSRLKSGRFRVDLRPVPLGDFVRHTVADLGAAIAEHTVRVDDTDVVARIDRDALARVLVNLIGNAAKYSPAGSQIDVHLGVRDGWAEIVVADRGRGIDPADLATIFEEFERGRRAEKDGGFGLGLSVVRHLVGMQQGAVAIEAGRYGGTDVVVRLPLVDRPVAAV
ncbi:PAS domain-containing sensor histidine kinase [Nocardioides acrostichi]|uniref:Sensor-like histidine kinase SenX3 n=1 Tax=Nocardioides acrostichi TaxID=2784339 RepID=A0A930V2S8_9ACTN|nr:PAS domain-containing sensor histidine kinase [Nocardioides acrostichi]MBF4162139.1 PAS domain S-box protein [Nocardioides acrostichi]